MSRIIRRPRRQLDVDNRGEKRRKPDLNKGFRFNDRFKSPSFLWMNGDTLDLISCERAEVEEFNPLTTGFNDLHGRSQRHNAVIEDGGQIGTLLSWPGIGTLMQKDYFTSLIVFQATSYGTTWWTGLIGGGYKFSDSSERSWTVQHNVSTSQWLFGCYNTLSTLYTVASSNSSIENDISIVVVRKRGSELAIWNDGVKTSNTTFSGAISTSTDPALLGGAYTNHTNSYPFDGDMWMWAFWDDTLEDKEIDELCSSPYSFISQNSRFVIPTESGYWGIDHYYRLIAGTL